MRESFISSWLRNGGYLSAGSGPCCQSCRIGTRPKTRRQEQKASEGASISESSLMNLHRTVSWRTCAMYCLLCPPLTQLKYAEYVIPSASYIATLQATLRPITHTIDTHMNGGSFAQRGSHMFVNFVQVVHLLLLQGLRRSSGVRPFTF